MKPLYKNMFNSVNGAQPAEDELELINRYTVKPLTADEVFCFTVTLCDNEVDRDFERFSVDALRALAPMFEGKTGITDHRMQAENQNSRIFKTWIEESETEKTTLGENYTALKARAYMPRTPKAEQFIAEIKAGIKKETSISCSVSKAVCSVCGKNIKKEGCQHRKGEIYNGRLCHAVLENPTDAYEFSFVAVPAQPRAGVTKAFNAEDSMTLEEIKKQSAEFDGITLSRTAFMNLTEQLHKHEQLANDAVLYRKGLESRVVRFGTMAVPSLSGTDFEDICKALTASQLSTLAKAFESQAAKRYPLYPQLGTAAEKETTNNNEFKI